MLLPELPDVIVTFTGFDRWPDFLSCTVNCTTAGVARLLPGTGAARVLPFTTLVDNVLPFHKTTASLEKFAPTTVIVTPFVPATTDPGSTRLMLGDPSGIATTPQPIQNRRSEMPTLAATDFNTVKIAPLNPFKLPPSQHCQTCKHAIFCITQPPPYRRRYRLLQSLKVAEAFDAFGESTRTLIREIIKSTDIS